MVVPGRLIVVGAGSAIAIAEVVDVAVDGLVHVRPLPGPVTEQERASLLVACQRFVNGTVNGTSTGRWRRRWSVLRSAGGCAPAGVGGRPAGEHVVDRTGTTGHLRPPTRATGLNITTSYCGSKTRRSRCSVHEPIAELHRPVR